MNTESTTSKKKEAAEDELLIDTSKMSTDERAAMEIAESARQKEWTYRSFCAQLFMGNCDFGLISPFPEQTAEDKKVGDDFIAELSKFLEENLDPDEVDETGIIPQKVIDGMFKLGVFAMKVPKEYDGLGFSQVNYNRTMMMIASYCASTAVLVSAHQSIGIPQPLKMYGTPEQKKKYLPRFRKDWISGFALTEPAAGSDPAQMTTEAVPIENGKFYKLNGLKQWCTNAPIGDVFVVMARTPSKMVGGRERKQVTAFIVERAMPGVEVTHRCDFMGLNGMQNGLLKFTDVKVPVENMIYKEGAGLKMALGTLNIGRLTIPAATVGAAKQCLSIARRFGTARVQWGKPVAQHEAGRDKIAGIASTTFAMEAMTWLCSHFADRPDRDIRLEAAMAKLFCSESCWRIVDTTMQMCGGRGYETAQSLKKRGEIPYPVERIMRDCRINTIIEGTSEIMRLFMAREAMDPHFSLAGPLMKKNVPLPEKVKAFFKMAGFYATWYPAQWFGAAFTGFYPEMGSLAGHVRYVKGRSHKLARTLFHCMAIYQQRLESRQKLLAHLVDIGMELFAMATACSYASHLVKKNSGDKSPVELADYFCSQARRRVAEHFKAIRNNDDGKMNKLAVAVLGRKMSWLEQGIIHIGPDA